MRTEGDSATTAPNRRMMFVDRAVPFYNQWGDIVGSPASIYDNANLHASVRRFAGRRPHGSRDPDNLVFSPIADGIVHAQVKEQNDYGLGIYVGLLVAGTLDPLPEQHLR